MVDVDIFVSNPTQIDWDVYQLWLKGYTGYEAASVLQKSGVLEEYEASFDDLRSETMDNYRLFYKLEYYLKNPQKMPEQQIFIMDPETKRLAIEYYYQFDDEVMRELIGKKLSTRNRKDLDDVCEKVRVPIRACRRQFDNIKRVFKEVEDLVGSLVVNIKTHMCISITLAAQYASIVFIANNRFELNKKRLTYLTCADLMYCSNLMIQNWSNTSSEDIGLELDREFVNQLRDLRVLFERDFMDDHKLIVQKQLWHKVSDRVYHEADSIFRNFSKIVISIACNLNHSKDLRDFFIDTVEKIIDPLQHLHWSVQDVHVFLNVYKQACHKIHTMPAELIPVFERYMTTMSCCIERMCHT